MVTVSYGWKSSENIDVFPHLIGNSDYVYNVIKFWLQLHASSESVHRIMSAVKYVGGILASKQHTDCNSFLIYEHTNIFFDNITAEIFCTNTSKQLNTKLYSMSNYRSIHSYCSNIAAVVKSIQHIRFDYNKYKYYFLIFCYFFSQQTSI